MKTKVLAAFLFLVLASTQTLAARPSITSLQQQINQLNAEVDALQAQVNQQPRQPVLLDSVDAKVGDVLTVEYDGFTFDSSAAVISLAANQGLEASIIYSLGRDFIGAGILYDQERCTGNIVGIERVGRLITLSGVDDVGRPATGIIVYVPDTSNPATNITYASSRNGSTCGSPATPQTIAGYPLLQSIDLSGAGFVPPYRIVAAP